MEKGFYLYTGDSMEQLAAQYAAARRKDPDQFHGKDLFSVEEIIVPSKGMGRWLERCLADQGVMLANTRFSSLFAFFNRLFRQTDDAFDRDPLVWRIVSVLGNDTSGSFPELAAYVNGGKPEESHELRRFSLAEKIADLFEQYLTECPEMLSGWSKDGTPENELSWQAKLWKCLCRDAEGKAIKSSADRMSELLDGSRVPESLSFPITVWGCSTMPLRQLAVLKRVSSAVPVHYFCLNPCDSLWKDDLRKQWSDGRDIAEPEEVEALYERTLLRQWSNHERVFFRYLTDMAELPCCAGKKLAERRVWQCSGDASAPALRKRFTDDGKNAVPGPHGTLQHLQNIFRGGNETRPEADDTLTIHCCHNELREVEILRDHLLHLIEKHGYSNSDILVAAPDISVFVPCIEAVFRQPVKIGDKEKSLAYTINGRSIRQNNPLAGAFILLLDVGRYRYELGFIEKLLNFHEIRSCFSIGEDEIGQLIRDCEEAGIRWGLDGDHRKYGFVDFDNYSWRHGLDRMLLGLALPDEGTLDAVWNETAAPFDKFDSPDGHARLLKLISLLQALRKVELDFATPCTVEEWEKRLKWLMETFFRRDMDRKAHYRGLWEAIHAVCSGITHGGYTQKDIPLEVIREAIAAHIRVPEEGSSFLSGAISFSNLRDIRGIPCKVLCLLGMDNGIYPRASRPDSLNLLEKQLTEECRTVSQQDRYFFLESFLAVRDYLLIYYRGMDDASDKRYYSSVLVSDLRGYAEKIFTEMVRTKERMDADDFGIEVRHSLLPYSHRYYTDNQDEPTLRNLWSYNAANRQIDAYVNGSGDWLGPGFAIQGAAEDPLLGAREPEKERKVPEFLRRQSESFRRSDLISEEQMDEIRKTPVTVRLRRELEPFVQNAGFTFLKESMDFNRLKKIDGTLPDVEPVRLDGLDRWTVVKEKIFPWMLELDRSPEDLSLEDLKKIYRRLKAENAAPISGGEELCMSDALSIAWIHDDESRETWKAQNCRGRSKRGLILEFPGDDPSRAIPCIPCNTPYHELPELFGDSKNILGSASSYYRNVKIEFETTKEVYESYIYLALASKQPKHRMRAFVRHLFLNAAGERCESVLIWKDGRPKTYEAMGQEEARNKLRALLALYLHGRTHAVPFLCGCSAKAANQSGGEEDRAEWLKEYSKKAEDNRQAGDDQLDYAVMLWARDKNDLRDQEELCRAIEGLARNILGGV